MAGAGVLVLVGTPIGNLGDLSPRAVEALRDADVIAAEDTRRTRALLTAAGVPGGNRLRAVHGHNERAQTGGIVELVRGGALVAYVTDAGMPGVSDPGSRMVRACLDAGLTVDVVPGPSAVLTALVLSGLPTARFAFEGFLPRRGRERAERVAAVARDDRTTVVFEAPHRVAQTLDDLAAACGGDREVALARELTKLHEEVWRGPLDEARSHVADTSPRGEFVIVVAPITARAIDTSDDELAEQARVLVEEGIPTREAADRLAVLLQVPKRRAYDAVITQRRAR
jgi:16S rRNA (cytidine1402-2'-O)-methyltransferase